MEHYRRDDLVFDVRDAGPPDGSVVVLLHGFPQRNDSWNAVIDRLTAEGYRCLAPNQRGYSPGARPFRRRDYRMSELVADISAASRRVHEIARDQSSGSGFLVHVRLPVATGTGMAVDAPQRRFRLRIPAAERADSSR